MTCGARHFFKQQSRYTVLLVCVFMGCSHINMGLFMLNSNPNESDSLSVARGAEAFQKNCARCHGEQADGKGAEATKLSVSPTDFTSPIYSKSAARLAARISYGKGDEMPAYSETLPYDTVWDIANYLESLQLKR